ncbi:tubulin binding cofactor C-domain-containing protein [Cladorrhinum sp. PSN332]|nr:tubulin binding cofactor C-domain-containing protein [Cladorrhinum sp. PSN332]
MSSPPTLDPKARFHHQFQHSVSTITSQIQSLPSLSSSPSIGELRDAIDHILASISRLSTSVSDAGADSTLPAHDQRVYSDSVKSLRDQLDEMRAKVEPKQAKRFTFKKRTGPSPSTTTTGRTDSRKLGSVGNTDQQISTPKVEEEDEKTPAAAAVKDYNAELKLSSSFSSALAPQRRPGTTTTTTEDGGGGGGGGSNLVRRPSFSSARSITISSHENLHIILPASASHATSAGQLTDLKNCVVDMSTPTAREGGTPFASLALKSIESCLIVAGHVDGPVHITGIKNSVIVVAARQVRIHECEGVDVYLYVASHPIIEHCVGMRFAPAPGEFLTAENETEGKKNEWEKVDDFNWLKEGVRSPNWGVIPEGERVEEGDWRRIVSGDGGRLGREDILRRVGVGKRVGV